MVDVSDGAGEASDLPPPSIPENLPFTFHGIANKDGEELWRQILTSTISSYLNLQRLDGVTVAVDYAGALAALDRGFPVSVPLKPSTELAQGVAMAPLVFRDGVVKAHLMLDASHH
jgi:hypothetical protein